VVIADLGLKPKNPTNSKKKKKKWWKISTKGLESAPSLL
jgi:hypothetical protein